MPNNNDAVRLVVNLRPDVWQELKEAKGRLDFDKASDLAAEVLRVWLTEYTGRNLPADELDVATPNDARDKAGVARVPAPQPAADLGRVLDLPDEDELAERRQAEQDRADDQARALDNLGNGERYLQVVPGPPVVVAVHVPPRNPNAWKCWAKVVTAVDPDARNGFAFDGDWLRRGDLVDLAPGSVILVADDLGTRNRRNLCVDVHQVNDDGSLQHLVSSEGRTWAADVKPVVQNAVNQ